MKILLSIFICAMMQAQTWTPITPGGTGIKANGDQYKLLDDTTNHELLYPCHPTTASTIYSSGICAYKSGPQTWAIRVANATTTQNCASDGAPWNGYVPLNGHLNGYWWIDNSAQKAYQTNALCNTFFMGITNVYQTNTQTMGANINVGPWGTGDGTFNATGVNYQSIVYIPSYGKAVFGCSNANSTGVHVREFNGSTWANVSGSVTGTLPGNAGLITSQAVMTDGTYLWILGGCSGTTPGNFSPNLCSGSNQNDLFKYDPTTKVFTKMAPVGGIKPPTTFGSYPFSYYDSLRARIVWYADTNKVWTYTISTNAWTEFTTTGGFTIPISGSIGPNGNVAAYDSFTDTGVFMYPVSGIGSAPLVYHLNFSSSFSTALTVQEALYPGGYAGATRTNEPFCGGVAILDSANITSVNSLTMTGTSYGQFRLLGSWPSGNLKWVKACAVVPSLTGGSTATVTLTNGGGGNFGGSNLATDNGSTITLATGAATFTIKKANFNGLDVVDVGATHAVLAGASDGFVITGPDPTAVYPGNVTCSPTSGGSTCATLYKSSYDSSSTCSISENGPVMANIKCTWTYKDAGGTHSYGNGTAYIYAYVGKTYARVTPVYRNADYGTANTFATAFKGNKGYELRLALNTSGTQSVSVGSHSGTTTASVSGSDDVYIYQGLSTSRQFENNSAIYPYTTDSGYIIRKNGSTSGLTGTTSGTAAQPPAGWANISDSGGVGVEIGQYWMGPMGTKSLEFAGGGPDVRLGILAPQNSQPTYLEWPSWVHESDLWLNFHASTPAGLDTEFQNWQAYLIGRQSITDYNAAAVFPHSILTATAQDTYETTAFTAANPATISAGNKWSTANVTNGAPDNCPGTNACPNVVRNFAWDLESDYRWDYLMTWIQRGWTARFLQAAHFYDFQAQYAWPHSDGFNWYDHWNSSFTEVDGFGYPRVSTNPSTAANQTIGLHGSAGGSHPFDNHAWHDQEHNHTWGQFDYCYMSGDLFCADSLVSQKNWYLAPNTFQNGGYPASTTVTTVSGNATITLTCCSTWADKVIGQTILLGTGLKTAYQVVSRTDTTHVVVTPTPTASVTNSPAIWSNGLFNTRAAASNMIVGSRYASYLQAAGDSDYSNVENQLKNLFREQVKADLCASGYPGACNPGTPTSPTENEGVSRKRGLHWGAGGSSGTWCAISNAYRVNSAFQSALMTEALIETRAHLGASTDTASDYWTATDLAYGISQFALTELYVNTGTGQWTTDGFRFGLALDVVNNCNAAGDLYTVQTDGTTHVVNLGAKSFAGIFPSSTVSGPPSSTGLFIINGTKYQVASVQDANNLTLTTTAPINASQSAYIQEVNFQYPNPNLNVMQLFYSKWLTDGSTSDWSSKMQLASQMDMGVSGRAFRDWMGHYETQAIYTINNPGTATLQTLIHGFTDNGGGSYGLTWDTPSGTQYLRVKYAATPITDWIGYDPGTNTFTGTSTNTNWFAGINASSIPAASTGTQGMTLTGLPTGLVSSNFSVKAMTTGTPSGGGGTILTGKVTITGGVVH